MNADLSKAIIVDVRTPGEFGEGHHPEAVNIPLSEVQNRLPEFAHLQKPVICYCRNGNRSGMAVWLLKQGGITDVYNGGSLEDMLRIKGHHHT